MDGLREAISAATEAAETAAAVEPAVEVKSVESATPEPKTEVPTEPTTVQPEVPAANKVETDPTIKPEEKAEEPRNEHKIDRPPQSWKADAKQSWGDLPLHVKQEVYRREQQVNQVLQETTHDRKLAAEFGQVTAPYMARIQTYGISPAQAAGQLFQADYMLSSAPMPQRAQLMAKLIADYGIDIQALDTALSGNVSQNTQPDIEAIIQQRITAAMAPFTQQQEQAALQSQQAVNDEVQQMSLDPAYPYFDDVRNEMADIIELYSRRGVSISLPEAYNKAIQLNPNTAQQANRQSQHDAAQKAKAAAVSVTNKPAAVTSTNLQTGTSLRDTISAAMETSGGRV